MQKWSISMDQGHVVPFHLISSGYLGFKTWDEKKGKYSACYGTSTELREGEQHNKHLNGPFFSWSQVLTNEKNQYLVY